MKLPQIEFKLPVASTAQYWPDAEQESEYVALLGKDGKVIVIVPFDFYEATCAKEKV